MQSKINRFVVGIFAFVLALSFASAADPGHTAGAVGPGTFEAGNYVFPNNITVNEYVGIGTAGPLGLLHVNGSDPDLIFERSGFWRLHFQSTAGESEIWSEDTGNGEGKLILQQSSPGGVGIGGEPGVGKLYVNGSVGIGTTSPASSLHVAVGNITLAGWINNLSAPLVSTDAATKAYVDTAISGVNASSSADDDWNVSGSNLFPKSLAYNVGIGTTSPQQRLHVSGNFQVGTIGNAGGIGIGQGVYPFDGYFNYTDDGTGYGPAFLHTNTAQPGTPTPTFWLTTAGNNTVATVSGDLRLGTTTISTLGQSPNVTTRTYIAGLPNTNSYINNGGNVGIGTASPSQKLDVRGNGNFSGTVYLNNGTEILSYINTNIAGNSSSGDSNGTATFVPYVGANKNINLGANNFTVDTNTLHVDVNNNRVGIGAAVPNYSLDVRANSGRIAGFYGGSVDEVGEESLIHIGGSSLASHYGVEIGGTPEVSTPSVQDWAFVVKTNPTTGTEHIERFRITSDGRVGIGTTSPVSKLNVDVGDGSGDGLYITNGTTNIAELYRGSSSTDPGVLNLYANDAVGIRLNAEPGTASYLNSGNVGIGTTTPSQKLDVRGIGNFSGTIYINNGTDISAIASGSNGTATFVPYVGANKNVNLGANNFTVDTNVLHVDSTNNRVGIGTSTPFNRRLYIQGDDNSTGGNVVAVRNSNSAAGAFINFLAGESNAPSIGAKGNDIVFTADNADGTEWVRIQSGNLGVGTSAPSQRLDVRGNGNFSGTVYLNNNTDILAYVNTNVIGNSSGGTSNSTSTYVPYVGASKNVNFGVFNFTTTGRVGIGAAPTSSNLFVYGSTESRIHTGGNDEVRHYSDVASFSGSGAPMNSITGEIVIGMPKNWSDTMFNIRIQGYDYTSRGAWEVMVGGYNYASQSWINTNVEIHGRPPFNIVRLASNGTRNVIILGNATTSWSYAKVVVSDVYASFSGDTDWGVGWSIYNTTSESAFVNINTPTIHRYTDQSGNLGVGTNLPSQKLDVAGNARIQGYGNFSGTVYLNNGTEILNYINTNIAGNSSGGTSNSTTTYVPYVGASKPVHLGANNFSVDSSVFFASAVNDRVGIGTNTPTVKFEVRGTTGVSGNGGDIYGNAENSYIGVDAGQSRLGLVKKWGDYPVIAADSATPIKIGHFNSSGLLNNIQNNTFTADLVISSAGSVGIGTTSPSHKLEVNAGNDEGIWLVNGSTSVVEIFKNGGTTDGRVILKSGGAVKIDLNANASSYFNNGNVGIGITSPSDKLHVQDGKISVTNGSNFGLTFAAANATTRGGYIQTKSGTDWNTAVSIFDNGVGIGTNVPTQKLDVRGSGNFSGTVYINNGTDISSLVAGADDWNVSGSNLYPLSLGYNVGLGTTTPSDKLNVVGGVNITRLGNSVVGLSITGTSTNTGQLRLYFNTTTPKFFEFQAYPANDDLYISNTSLNPLFKIRNEGPVAVYQGLAVGTSYVDTTPPANGAIIHGNVGIGTSSPQAKLQVSSGTNGDSVLRLEADTDNDNEADNPWLEFRQDADLVQGTIGLSGAAGSAFGVTVTDALENAFIINTNVSGATGKLQLATENRARLTIDHNGLVGIGTTAPEEELHLYGNGNQNVKIQSANSNEAGVILNSSGNQWKIYNPAGSTDLRIYNTNDLFSFEANGNLGVGTTAPSQRLDVRGNGNFSGTVYLNNGTEILNYINTNIAGNSTSGDSNGTGTYVPYVGANKNTALGIYNLTTTGMVGVGTATPVTGSKLDVAGTLAYGSDSSHKDYIELVEYQTSTSFNNFTINTNIPFQSGYTMPYITIDGYAYGSAETIGINLVFYVYDNGFTNVGASSFGGYIPTALTVFNNTNGKISINIYDSGGLYYPRFKVSARKTLSESASDFTGWTVTNTGVPNGVSDAVNVTIESIAQRIGVGTSDPSGLLQVYDGSTTSLFVSTAGIVGVGTASPIASSGIARLVVRGDSSTGLQGVKIEHGELNKNWTLAIGGSGNSFQGGFAIADEGTARLVVQNTTGRVGIGTTTPSRELDVRGIGNFSGTVYVNNNTDILALVNSINTSSSAADDWNLSSGLLYPKDLSYKVGINNSNPTQTLTINGNQFLNGTLYFQYRDSATYGSWRVQSGYSYSPAELLFMNSSGNTKVTFQQGGNVGIGAHSPTTLLHVNGSAVSNRGQISVSSNSGNDAYASFYSGTLGDTYKGYVGFLSSPNVFTVGATDNLPLTFRTSSSGEVLRIVNEGNLSLSSGKWITNLSNPLAPQDAATKAYVDALNASASSSEQWNVSGNNLFPKSLGYSVGINTTAPTSTLEVKGTFNASTTNGGAALTQAGDFRIGI